MQQDIAALCSKLDEIRQEQDLLRKRQDQLTKMSVDLDAELQKILHGHIDPLLKGHWHARIVLYKDTKL